MNEIRLDHVEFSYAGEVTLSGIDLRIDESDFVAVIGPSGCGKSTLLRLISGLVAPTGGRIAVDGRPVTGPGLDRAMVFQDYSLFPWMNCLENIVLALKQVNRGASRRERRRIAAEYLELVGLGHDSHKLPGELSGGMRQRAAIARALAMNSPILLMDEPFGALDAITRARQQDLLLDLWQSNGTLRKTVVFVTHDVDEALILANRVIVLGTRPGRVLCDLAVDLPRPRSRMNSLSDARFSELRETLLSELNRAVNLQLDAAALSEDGAGI